MKKHDFPILEQKANDEPLIYLDNAATTQKPEKVIKAIDHYYKKYNANIYRGAHTLSYKATTHYEKVRHKVQKFINAPQSKEIIFTKGTTQSLNWIAFGYFLKKLQPGDEIIVSKMEHHSNLIPWQQVAQQTGAVLRFIDFTADGRLDMEQAATLFNDKTKVVAVNYVSNVFGTINPIKEITTLAHQVKALVVVDASQAVGHLKIDVQALDVDFLAFSGHKMYAATGIGVLYGKEQYLEQITPLEFGGEMIDQVTLTGATFKALPARLEGGTPNIAGVISLGAAIEYLKEQKLSEIAKHEHDLTKLCLRELKELGGVQLVGPTTAHNRTGVISFNLRGLHPHDVATALDMQGIAVRAGNHCAQPLFNELQLNGSVRVSFAFYNTKKEVHQLIKALKRTKEFFK